MHTLLSEDKVIHRSELSKRKYRLTKHKKFGHHRYTLWGTAKTEDEAWKKARSLRLRYWVRVHKTRGHPEARYLIYVIEPRQGKRRQKG